MKAKKDKLKARAANKLGYRDPIMSTEGILLNIVENATSKEWTKRRHKKGSGKTCKKVEPETQSRQSCGLHQIRQLQAESTRQRPIDWLTFMEKK